MRRAGESVEEGIGFLRMQRNFTAMRTSSGKATAEAEAGEEEEEEEEEE